MDAPVSADLGMSFAEWRWLLRVVTSMPPLEAGNTVEYAEPDLGYVSASAFITMFRRMLNVTPNEFRREGGRVGRSPSFEMDRRPGKPTGCCHLAALTADKPHQIMARLHHLHPFENGISGKKLFACYVTPHSR